VRTRKYWLLNIVCWDYGISLLPRFPAAALTLQVKWPPVPNGAGGIVFQRHAVEGEN